VCVELGPEDVQEPFTKEERCFSRSSTAHKQKTYFSAALIASISFFQRRRSSSVRADASWSRVQRRNAFARRYLEKPPISAVNTSTIGRVGCAAAVAAT